ncbi:MAG: hypothetical protein MUE68_08145 [Bacteroidetes bacterium]|jgi:hypothetical protein|nr:hypothetical protein [Bacteroidota bacterium]
MPVSVRLEPARERVVLSGSGTVDLDEVLRLLDGLSEAGQEIRGRDGLIETAQITGTSMTFDSIRRISDRVSQMDELFRGTRWAVVAPGDAMFGISRMYETLRSGGTFEIRTFRSTEEAEMWLRRRSSTL